jgi:hypothetical protein
MSARIRAGSKFKRFFSFVLPDVMRFRVLAVVLVPQVEDYCSMVCSQYVADYDLEVLLAKSIHLTSIYNINFGQCRSRESAS